MIYISYENIKYFIFMSVTTDFGQIIAYSNLTKSQALKDRLSQGLGLELVLVKTWCGGGIPTTIMLIIFVNCFIFRWSIYNKYSSVLITEVCAKPPRIYQVILRFST